MTLIVILSVSIARRRKILQNKSPCINSDAKNRKEPGCPLKRRLDEPKNGWDVLEKRTTSFIYQDSNPGLSGQ
jgi:hypothetical protein